MLSFKKIITLLVMGCFLVIADAFGKTSDTDYVERAIQYQNKGELQAAVIELKNALQQNPDNAQARWLLGKLYVQQGDGVSAQKELELALAAGISYEDVVVPLGKAYVLQQSYQAVLDKIRTRDDMKSQTKAEVLALRGQAYYVLGKLDEANTAFHDALAQQPAFVEAMGGLAQVTFLQGKHEEAKKWLDEAIATAPDKTAVWLLQGDFLRQQGDMPGAEAAYNKVLSLDANHFPGRLNLIGVLLFQNKIDEAGKALDAIQGKAGLHPQALYYRALIAFSKGDYALAQERLQELFKDYPDYAPALHLMAMTQYNLGYLEQADAAARQLVERFPDSAEAKKLKKLIDLKKNPSDPDKRQENISSLLAQFPQDVQVLNTVADSLLAQGQRAEAIEPLKKVVELQPQSAAAHARLGEVLLQQGKPESAIPALEKARELGLQSPQLELLLVNGYIAAKDYDRALTALQPRREQEPQNAALWNLTGTAYEGKGQLDKAEAAFQKALALTPGDPTATASLERLRLGGGDIGKARLYYQQALAMKPDDLQSRLKLAELEWQQGDREAATRQLDEAIRRQPDALQPRLVRARAYLEEKQPAKALYLLKEVEQQHGSDPDFLLTMGRAQLAAGDTNDAILSFNRLTVLQPYSAQAQYWLAGAYGQRKNPEQMRKPLFQGLTLQPDDPLAGPLMVLWLSLAPDAKEADRMLQALQKQFPKNRQVLMVAGQTAQQREDYKQAVKVYQQALTLFPDDAILTNGLVWSYLKSGNEADFFSTLQSWLEKHPQDGQARFLLANQYLSLKRYDEATAAYTKLLELAPDNPEVLNNLALALRKKNPQQARQYAEKALTLLPDNGSVMDTLAVILLDQSDTQRALELLRKASQLQPKPEIRYHLAQALVKNGRKDEARQVLREILADQTTFDSRQQASALLKELGG